MFFQRYHLKHHAFQGVYELDADIPNTWEARLVGTSPWRKAIWLLLFPLVQSTRPPRLREIRPIDRWVVLNLVVQIGFDVAVWFVLGPRAFAYLFISFFFSVGLHPLGARWVQEHYLLFHGQETNSYYGWLNRLALNVGYHNEHHDFPSVPWNRLPELKRTAPEAYDSLGSHSLVVEASLAVPLRPARFALCPTGPPGSRRCAARQRRDARRRADRAREIRSRHRRPRRSRLPRPRGGRRPLLIGALRVS